jgi:hypothetical protein
MNPSTPDPASSTDAPAADAPPNIRRLADAHLRRRDEQPDPQR